MRKAWNRFRLFEIVVALLGVLAFVMIGPLRDAFATLPGVMLVAVLILFLIPGALVTRWFLREHFAGAAMLPAAS